MGSVRVSTRPSTSQTTSINLINHISGPVSILEATRVYNTTSCLITCQWLSLRIIRACRIGGSCCTDAVRILRWILCGIICRSTDEKHLKFDMTKNAHITKVPSPRSMTSGAHVLPVVAQPPTSGSASDPDTDQVTPPSVDVAIWMFTDPEFVENA